MLFRSDIEGATYNWRERYLLVEDGTILGLRFSQRHQEPPITRVVIDQTTDTKYNIITSGNSLVIEFIHQQIVAAEKLVYVGAKPKIVREAKTDRKSVV